MIQTNIVEQLNKAWLVDQDYVSQYMPILKVYLETGKLPKEDGVDYGQLRGSLRMFAIDAQSKVSQSYNEVNSGSIAVIPIKGLMMKDDGLCSKGTASIAKEIQQANDNDFINSIILKIDSGGGAVDGTETLANVIKQSNKPVVTFVDGTMGSAAVWAGSQSDEIILSGETTRVGSIGTMMTLPDTKELLESKGVKLHTIRATKSVDKNSDIDSIREGNYESIQLNHLDKLNDVFLSAVSNARGSKIKNQDEVFTGKIFYGSDAINKGLADSIGTFEGAVNRAIELGTNNNNNKISTDMNIKEELNAMGAKISAMVKGLGAEANADNPEVTELQDKFNALSDEFNAEESVKAELETLKTESAETIANLETTVSGLEEEKTTLADLNATQLNEIASLKAANLELSGEGKEAVTPAAATKNDDLDEAPLTDAEIIAKNAEFLANNK